MKKKKLTPHERAVKAAAASPWKRKPACATTHAKKVFERTNKKKPT